MEEEPLDLHAGIRINRLGYDTEHRSKLSDIHLNAYEGHITVLFASSAAGKSTLIDMLAGFHPPSRGSASVNGHDIRVSVDRNHFFQLFIVIIFITCVQIWVMWSKLVIIFQFEVKKLLFCYFKVIVCQNLVCKVQIVDFQVKILVMRSKLVKILGFAGHNSPV